MLITAGLDIGSLSTKAAIVAEGQLLSFCILPTGRGGSEVAERALEEALNRANVKRKELKGIVATGYGRISIPFADRRVTEITCHARGAWHLFPEVATVIDIGGQDSKVIRVGPGGKVLDFEMNEKCAAGTGRFLEVMARALEVELGEMGKMAVKARRAAPISSTCTVFAESEVVSLLAEGRPLEEILKGLHYAVAERVVAMAQRLGWERPVVMSGGVAKNIGVVKSLEERLGTSLYIPAEPQILGALGAALLAAEEN
ncbi:MAG: acyl-CoA dehydratase activase [Thermanaeromonas sp.]|uniref:acyl-CoA dehydratase activase n=1 Tax=Thermanaeromonas sp. TaxID=2003697 RepID=UPI002437C5F6|nr:acyl-CoA dehydratase activase [Thermanaeromonas sp.]MCG0277167.1 acyl-CoA dehydratase activase [Thermanaeromonas sp.]